MTDEGATTKSAKTKKTRSRSPNYPALNLADAVERTKTVFEKLGRSMVGDEDVVKALGYNSLNGTSRSVVSALKKYGFLQPDGDGFRVSDDALDIINLPSDDPDRARAMYEAALRPALFAELHETYGDNPPGDSLLRNYLFKRNFNPKVADEVIRLYRDTMDLVSRKVEEYTADDEPTDEQQETQMQQQERNTGNPGNASSGGPDAFMTDIQGSVVKRQHYGLSEDGDVYLVFVGKHPSKEDIDTLKEYLNTFKKGLPSEKPIENANEGTPKGSSTSDEAVSSENGHSSE